MNIKQAPQKETNTSSLILELEKKVEKKELDLKRSNDLLKSLNSMLGKEITAREKTETLLKAEQRRTTNLMENLPIIVFLICPDHTIHYGNTLFKKHIGAYKNQYCFELMYCKDSKCEDCVADKVLLTGEHQRTEWQSQSGEYFAMHFYPYKELDDEKIVLGLGIDITDRKKIEQELNNAKKEAEKSSLFKSQFLARMSHEIRTPMNGVIGMTDILMDTPLSSEQKDYLSILKNSGETLLTIINDILDISKIEAGKFELDIKPFNIKSSVQDVYQLLKPKAHEKNIGFSFSFQKNIHPYLNGDATRIRQILFNLVGNAIKFTHKGEVSIVVEHKTIDSERIGIQFEIIDTGIGIPEDQQREIFKSFTQVNGTGHQYGGTGLGLSICSLLINIMNGKLWVTSEIDQGSHFFFYLEMSKAKKNEVEESQTETPTQKENFSDQPKSSTKILIVEDNNVNQKVFLLLLNKLGFSCDVCDNGIEAIEILKDKFYDIIFMDIMMPKMNGIQATHYIRDQLSIEKQPIIIAVTADAVIGQREKYLKSGFDDYISKPVTNDVLFQVLKKYTEKLHKNKEMNDNKVIHDIGDIDFQQFKLLRRDTSEGYSEIIQTYIDESPIIIESLKKAIYSENFPEIRMAAHSLKSITSVFGESRLGNYCLEMENAAKKNSKIDYTMQLQKIMDAHSVINKYMKEELALLLK
ncbi:multi-sensor hybrid histidine kinase [Candidatus Magnetomorum sp. HK-1]|nr:multi-sensor hybrid histidine kinase [Candidatus Magnetomorum sp. HK-1]